MTVVVRSAVTDPDSSFRVPTHWSIMQ